MFVSPLVHIHTKTCISISWNIWRFIYLSALGLISLTVQSEYCFPFPCGKLHTLSFFFFFLNSALVLFSFFCLIHVLVYFVLFLKQKSTSSPIDFYGQKSSVFKAQPTLWGFAWRQEGSFSSYPNSACKCIGQWKSQSQGKDQGNSNSPFISLEWKPEDCWLLLWFNH